MSRSDGGPERRGAGRRTLTPDEPLSRIRLRAGRQLSVIDVSDLGLLAEGTMRLLPGMSVEIHIVTRDGRRLVRGRVVRAFVCQISADGIRYRGAFAFEQCVDTAPPGYVFPGTSTGFETARGRPYPNADASAPRSDDGDAFHSEIVRGPTVAPALE